MTATANAPNVDRSMRCGDRQTAHTTAPETATTTTIAAIGHKRRVFPPTTLIVTSGRLGYEYFLAVPVEVSAPGRLHIQRENVLPYAGCGQDDPWDDRDRLSCAEWRKSSYSSQSGNCVEVARNLPGLVAVRDSKEPGGARLVVSREA